MNIFVQILLFFICTCNFLKNAYAENSSSQQQNDTTKSTYQKCTVENEKEVNEQNEKRLDDKRELNRERHLEEHHDHKKE